MPRVAIVSPEAARVMLREFRQRTPAATIARLVLQETGETIAPRTIARRAAEFKAGELRRQAARDQMAALVEAVEHSDLTAEGMLRALAFQALLEDPAGVGADPVALQELRIKEKAVDLRARQIAVEEAKLKLLQDRERKLADAEKAVGKDLTPEEFHQRVREIYGLGEQHA
jgi:hypothetical protein